MPIYEYQCDRCNEIFEIFHKIDEDCKVACPKCLGSVKKLVSAPNFVLKGSGFYVNDYPSESRKEGKNRKEVPKNHPQRRTEKGRPRKRTEEGD
jgi:putative FmdB family regulatory protein